MKNIFLFLLTLFILSSCTKDEPITPDPQLPEITMTGENTFGCLVDGKIWRPGSNSLSVLHPVQGAKYDENANSLILFAKDLMNDPEEWIHLGVNTEETGLFNLANTDNDAFIRFNGSNCDFFYPDDENKLNQIYISKLDTINDIISGTFELTVISECNDSVRITDGRFDMEYRL